MTRFWEFVKRETVFVISAVIALCTFFIVPVDEEYFGYIDFNVLIILFCLMAAVAGFKRYGGFDLFSAKLLTRDKGEKFIPVILVMMCFFSSMVVTNDVALITFVPLTIYMIKDTSSDSLIYVVIMETLAANLGSLVTPIGNPQNLFLYHFYDLAISDFLEITLPLGAACLVIIAIFLFVIPAAEWESPKDLGVKKINKRKLIFFSVLFLACILSVLKILNYEWCLAIVVISLILRDRSIFAMVDYWLLLTFANFFIIVGNLTRIESINVLISSFISGRELISGVLVSQFISNVPAAIMLAPFTDSYKELILGVNIGGLGTLIASLASVISFKYYSIARGSRKGKYIIRFTIFNVLVMVVLIWMFK